MRLPTNLCQQPSCFADLFLPSSLTAVLSRVGFMCSHQPENAAKNDFMNSQSNSAFFQFGFPYGTNGEDRGFKRLNLSVNIKTFSPK